MGAILDAFGDILVAGTYLAAWLTPRVVGGERGVATLVGLIVLEFIIIHSSGLLGQAILSFQETGKGLRSILGLLAIYSLFAAAIAAGFKNAWLFVGFLALHVNRLLPLLLGFGDTPTIDRKAWTARWGFGALIYLAAAVISIVPLLPRLGAPSRLHGFGSGAWVDDPHRALAAGFIYFSGQAILLLTAALRGRWPRLGAKEDQGAVNQ